MIGLDYGHTELHLIDSNTPIDHNVSADIYVVKPHHLGKWAYPHIIFVKIHMYIHTEFMSVPYTMVCIVCFDL